MNFSFYTFGTPKGRYSQYPDDYTTSLITGFQRELTGIQLVIHREMNLMYYVFSERLDKTQTIGFCLVLNNARIKKPCTLISLFRFIVEIYLVNNKSIYQMDDDGRWKFKVDNLSGCFGEHQILKDFIDIEFDRFNFKYGIEPLSTIYNGTKTIGNLGLDVTTDHQILETTSRHNTVIIKGDRGIAQGNLSQTIALWQKRYEEVTNRNAQLSGELANLKRAKKQTRWVAILAIAVIASLIGIYFLNDNLSGKNNTIEQLQTSLDERELALESTQDSLDSVTQQLEVTANKLDLVGNEHPIVIENIEIGNIDDDGKTETDYGNTIYSSHTMYLTPKITYTGIKADKTLDIRVKWYRPDGSLSSGESSPAGFSFEESVHFYSWKTTTTLTGWGNKNRGHWKSGEHRIEIWYKDVCLKAKSFTIY